MPHTREIIMVRMENDDDRFVTKPVMIPVTCDSIGGPCVFRLGTLRSPLYRCHGRRAALCASRSQLRFGIVDAP